MLVIDKKKKKMLSSYSQEKEKENIYIYYLSLEEIIKFKVTLLCTLFFSFSFLNTHLIFVVNNKRE